MKSTGCSRFIIARLNGDEINSSMDRNLRLVREGIAGFIIFGGKLEPVREGIRRLQSESALPLVIASDLERGLGQQLEGGTVFPPAMALGNVWQKDRDIVIRSFEAVADEAAYAGINTIFAPVLDMDLNPHNPIISTRAFGRDPAIVSALSTAMIKAFRSRGIVSCGKHFPGHGDTTVDSHIGLPVLNKPLDILRGLELAPFAEAIGAGVPMIMTGHLSVPSLDPSGTPVTLSKRAIGFLRDEMGFKGIITTDAMDMGAIKQYGEAKAALMALEAGVDVLLHPSDPLVLSGQLDGKCSHECRLDSFRRTLTGIPSDKRPPVDNSIVEDLSLKALKTEGLLSYIRQPVVLALTDDRDFISPGAQALANLLDTEAIIVDGPGAVPAIGDRGLIVAVSSGISAYKGGSAKWIGKALEDLSGKAALLVSLSGPGLIEQMPANAPKIYAYWDSAFSGRAVYEVIRDAGK